MKELVLVVLGYIIHDALQPTIVGKVLDKVSLPGDLLEVDDPKAKAESTS